MKSRHLLFFQHTFVLYRHHLDEVLYVAVPVVEHPACQGGTRMQVVLANQFQQFLARHTVLHQINLHHVHIAEVVERVLGVIDVGYTSRHTCGKVPAGLAEHHHTTACHILTAVVAGALDDGYGSRVAHTEALAYLAIDVQLARGGTVETGVAGNDIVFRMEVLMAAAGGQYRDASAAQTLAEVVVALALQPDVETAHGEGTKRL